MPRSEEEDVNEDKRNALELALTNEKKEKEFYLSHADRTDDPLGRAMFESIAADEEEHYNRLLELHARLEERDRWPEDFAADISAGRVKAILDKVIESATVPEGSDEEDMKAVKVAIRFEEKGERFYSRLAAEAENESERHFFNLLASIEHEHLLSLQDTLAYFEDPKKWMEAKSGELEGG
jgi:rubrerythrin